MRKLLGFVVAVVGGLILRSIDQIGRVQIVMGLAGNIPEAYAIEALRFGGLIMVVVGLFFVFATNERAITAFKLSIGAFLIAWVAFYAGFHVERRPVAPAVDTSRHLSPREQGMVSNALKRAHSKGTRGAIAGIHWQAGDDESERYAKDIAAGFKVWSPPIESKLATPFPNHEKAGLWINHAGNGELAHGVFDALCSASMRMEIQDVGGKPSDSVSVWVSPNPKKLMP